MDQYDENIAKRIIRLYMSSDFPEDIDREVRLWLAGSHREQEKKEVLWEQWNELEVADYPEENKALNLVKARIGMASERVPLRRRMVRFTAIAASIALILASVVWLIKINDRTGEVTRVATVITTSEDEKRYTGLADGSEFWLNENSEAAYFEERNIVLRGEGFFEVNNVGDEKFCVSANGITVTVTGTRFNFRSYDNEQLSLISLYEGSLTIEAPDTVVYLRAGYEFEYDHTVDRGIVHETSRTRPDWMRDIINFEDVSVKEVLSSLEKIYGVNIDTSDVEALADRVELKFEGGLGLDEVMYFLSEISGSFGYSLDGDTIFLYNR